MKRFFVEQLHNGENTVLITGKELHHLKDVLRLKSGDSVAVFDGKGREFSGVIKSICRKEACIAIENRLEVSRESPVEIILAQGIAKAEKMDMIIQKATELGVSRIIPFVTSRVVAKASREHIAKKTQRWQRIALEAAKQCRRSVVPGVDEVMTFTEILSLPTTDKGKYLKIIPWEGEKKNNLKGILKTRAFSACIILIGPEGGFPEEEVVEAEKSGFLPVTLGPRILRTETAALSIVAIVQYELGDMGK